LNGLSTRCAAPISSKRYYPLRRLNVESEFNMQMGVLEGVVDTPVGVLRVYDVHFGSVSGEERELQASFVVKLVRDAPFADLASESRSA
jgi:hypothetical protein